MLPFAYYLLKVIICSGVLFGYYWIFLRNKIFHSYNRFYLLTIIALSLILPVMKINIWHKANEPQTNVIKMLQVVNSSDEYMDEIIVYSNYNHISKEQVFSTLYFVICAVFFFLLVRVLFKIRSLLKKNPATSIENIHFIKTNAKGTPFSFLKFIFWNDAIDIETKAGRQVFKHEVAHVKEKHSYDKLFINIILIFFWCNPFFWLIRKELNMIHEFVADQKAIEDGDTSDFAAMILHATYPQHQFQLTNNFFYSPIKRRLLMLTKQNKTKVNYISRLLVLPVAVIVFAAFTLKAKTYSTNSSYSNGKALTVMIDAGHGGTDKGAVSSDGFSEKDISFSIAKKIKELNHSGNIKIILTRETDDYLSPQQRVALAKEAGADLFISIHVDGEPEFAKIKKTGLSVFVSKDQYSNSEASKLLASSVISIFEKNYELPVAANPQQREKSIWVLQANSCPAVLIESGCINTKTDLDYLKTDKAIEQFASNVLKVIEDYSAYKDQTPAGTKSVNIDVDVKNTNADYLKSEAHKSKALIIVDSKEIGNFGNKYVEKNIQLFSSVVVYDPEKAINIYGEKGKYGVIKLTTKKTVQNDAPIPGILDHDLYIIGFQNTGGTHTPPWIWDEGAFTAATRPIFILNGKEVSSIKVYKISNDNITDIRVLTAKTAMPVYGDKARNGVIIMNTDKSPGPLNTLIVLDGMIYENKTWTDIMAANDFRAIDKMEVLEKDEAIKRYGAKGKNGAIIATTRPGSVQNPTYTLSGISGPRVHISQLKNIKEIQLNSPDYEFVYATVYFSGASFPYVVSTQLTGTSMDGLKQYLSRVVAGTNIVFDNVKIQKKSTHEAMEINGRAFSFYDKETESANIQTENIFTKVETEPAFPNGKTGWQEYLRKNIDAAMPVDEGWKAGSYTIVVQFIVDEDGFVSDVKTDNYSDSKTAKQCIDLIKNGPRWIPGKQNGNVVKAYKKQPITFVVSEQ